MNSRTQKIFSALALFLIFSISQVYVQANLARAKDRTKSAASLSLDPQAAAKLIVRGGQNILVNGNTAPSGASLLTGATIETPDNVGATIDLGPLGTIDLAPNTKIQLEYSDGQIKVKVIQGCVIVKSKKGTQAEVDTDQGKAAENDKNQAGALDVCFPPGASAPTVGQGAAAQAMGGIGSGGAGSGGAAAAASGAGGAEGGISIATGAAIGGAAVAGAILAAVYIPCRDSRGSNPSPSSPNNNDDCRRGF
jgi:hypothetical protein